MATPSRRALSKYILFPMALWAATVVPAHATWTTKLTVTGGFVEDGDDIVIHVAESTQFTAGCVGGRFIFNATNDDRRARAWATVLTALAANRPITLWYDGTCTRTYHRVTGIMIE